MKPISLYFLASVTFNTKTTTTNQNIKSYKILTKHLVKFITITL